MDKAYITGMSLTSALGSDLDKAVACLKRQKSNSTLVSIELGDDIYQMPYYAVSEPSVDIDSSRMEKILTKTVKDCIKDAGLSTEDLKNTPILVGSTSYDIRLSEEFARTDAAKGADSLLVGAGFTSLIHKVKKTMGLIGEVYLFNTACTSSANALLYGLRMIQTGYSHNALIIGMEFFNESTLMGFDSLELICRERMMPFGPGRDGMILGEGCSAILLSNELSPKMQKQRTTYYLKGGASLGDTYSMTSTNPDGSMVAETMTRALDNAGLKPQQVSIIKAHGTASLSNDRAEAEGIKQVFSVPPPVDVLKPFLGHTLGASGTNEITLFLSALDVRLLPAVSPASEMDPDCGLRWLTAEDVALTADDSLRHYMFNYFGFGGNNSVLIVSSENTGADTSDNVSSEVIE